MMNMDFENEFCVSKNFSNSKEWCMKLSLICDDSDDVKKVHI